MKTFFTPGPSQPYPGLEQFLVDALREHVVSLSHRSPAFMEMFRRTTDGLRQLMDIPADYHIYFLGSATEAMERIIQSTVRSRSHHFVNGAFSEIFFNVARQLGKDATEQRVPWGSGFGLEDMAMPDGTELVAFTHNESGTGAMLDLQDVYACKRAHPDVLVALDVVSSAPIVKLDFAYLDCVFFSVQKAYGLPAGLGVLIVSPAALAKAHSLAAQQHVIGSYHSFRSLAEFASKDQTPATPNVLGIYLLGRAVADLQARGIGQLRHDISARAEALYQLLDEHPTLQPFVAKPQHRSQTIIAAKVDDSALFVEPLAQQGLVIGTGYGDHQRMLLRIANFPTVDNKQMDKLLQALQSHRP